MTSRCPRCQGSVEKEWAVCPNCGLSRPGNSGRITCRHCGARARDTFRVCPSCGADLKAAPLPIWPLGRYFQFAAGALALAGIVYGAMQVKPEVERGAEQAVAFFMPTPTPTMTATGTATSTPTPTPTPTRTPSPTLTATPTVAPSPTPTVEAAEEATPTAPLPATVTPTPTPSLTPTPRFRAPALIGPPDGQIFTGREQYIVLRWEPAGELGENEWYAVRLSWAENGSLAQRGGNNLKEAAWQIPADFYWGKADHQTGRAYQWYVYVERVTVGENGERVGEAASPASATRTLYWQ